MIYDVFSIRISGAGLCVALASWIFVLILQRVLLHPLRRFPGPILASMTIWYRAYYDVVKRGAFLNHLAALHEKYGLRCATSPLLKSLILSCPGPVVRIGPNHVSWTIYRKSTVVDSRSCTSTTRQHTEIYTQLDPTRPKIPISMTALCRPERRLA